jgi:antitoxin HicB
MKPRYLYEAEFVQEEDGRYSVEFPQLPDAFTFGNDMAEAMDRAAEVLELIIGEYIDDGKPLPDPIFLGQSNDVLRVAISVTVTPEMIERMKCVSVGEAANMLKITKGRISQMLDANILQGVPFGNERLVTLASINERKKTPKGAGRPKKVPTLSA